MEGYQLSAISYQNRCDLLLRAEEGLAETDS
jgi:hypothetical protein